MIERSEPSQASLSVCSQSWLARLVLSCMLAVCVAFGTPATSWADVRKADIIVDVSVEERGLTLAECPSIDSEYAALVDENGEVYFSREGDSTTQIASITKVMTAIIALENAPDNLTVVVSEDAASIGESSANLQAGDELDFNAAMKALLVPSGNDAAYALAECIGEAVMRDNPSLGDTPIRAFVALMNNKAEELGCTKTIYDNPHGLDHDVYAGPLRSTALDQAKVARYAMTFPEIREIVSHGDTTIQVKREGKEETVELETTDGLLEEYEYAIGIKTGHTDLAGPSFMGAASKDGRELYAVVLDSSSEEQRFNDAKTLFEWYYDHVKELPLAQSDEHADVNYGGEERSVPIIAEVPHYDWLDRTIKATLKDPDATISVFDLEGNVSQSVVMDEPRGTINVGDKVGTITFRQRNMVIAEQDLVAAERVEAPNPIEALGILWQRLVGGLSGSDAQASPRVYNVMPIIDNNKTSAA